MASILLAMAFNKKLRIVPLLSLLLLLLLMTMVMDATSRSERGFETFQLRICVHNSTCV